MVFGAAEAEDVLDDDVLAADLDLAVAGGAAVELARDAADQPGLVALFGDPAQAPAFVWQAGEVGHDVNTSASLPARRTRDARLVAPRSQLSPREPGEAGGHRQVGGPGEAQAGLRP